MGASSLVFLLANLCHLPAPSSTSNINWHFVLPSCFASQSFQESIFSSFHVFVLAVLHLDHYKIYLSFCLYHVQLLRSDNLSHGKFPCVRLDISKIEFMVLLLSSKCNHNRAYTPETNSKAPLEKTKENKQSYLQRSVKRATCMKSNREKKMSNFTIQFDCFSSHILFNTILLSGCRLQ